jgi:hypothetical protein
MGLVSARRPGWLLERAGNDAPRGMVAQSRSRDGQNPAYRPSGDLRFASCRISALGRKAGTRKRPVSQCTSERAAHRAAPLDSPFRSEPGKSPPCAAAPPEPKHKSWAACIRRSNRIWRGRFCLRRQRRANKRSAARRDHRVEERHLAPYRLLELQRRCQIEVPLPQQQSRCRCPVRSRKLFPTSCRHTNKRLSGCNWA